MYYNTTGDYNTALGYYSLLDNTSGEDNTALGYYALEYNTDGNRNVALGRYAGRYIGDGSTANTTSDYSVYIGANTKALADDGQNEIVIGYNAIGVGSNSAVLGNDSMTKTILKGNVGIGTTTPNHKLDVAGNIGLSASGYLNWGSTDGETGYGIRDNSGTLQYKSSGGIWADIGSGGGGDSLWVDAGTYIYPLDGKPIGDPTSGGTNKVSGLYMADSGPLYFGADNDINFSFAGSTFTTTLGLNAWNIANDLLYLDGTTNQIGIGTTSPTSALSVGASSQFQVNSSGDIVKLKNLTYSWPSSHANGFLKDDGTGSLSWGTAGTSEITDNSLDFVDFQDTLDLDANLTLNQGAYTWVQNYTGTTGTGFTYNANSLTSGKGMALLSTSTGLTGNLAEFVLSGDNAANTGNVLRLAQTGTSSAAVPLMVTNLGTGDSFRVNDETGDTDSTPFVIDNSGNVGIGLSDPTSKLQIGGASSTISNDTGDIVIDSASGNVSLSGDNLINVNDGLFAGNLGVGTTTPIFQTEIYGAGQLTADMTDAGNRTGILAINGNSTTAGAGGAIVFGNSSSHTANSLGFAAIKGLLTDSTANTIGALAFSTRATTSATSLTERMRILPSGFVGIGLTNPSEMLGVNGSIVAEKYYDLTNKNYYLDPAAVGVSLKIAGSAEIEGNIGIGTASTAYKLSIGGATSVISNLSGDITIDPASGNLSLAGNNLINVADGTFVNGYFSNSVGIGTITPGAKLDIQTAGYGLPVTSGTAQTYGGLRISPPSASGNVVLDMGTSGGTTGTWLQTTNRTDLSASYPLLLNPRGGNVGIGTTGAPDARLTLSMVNSLGWGGNLKALKIYAPDTSYYLTLNTILNGAGAPVFQFSPNTLTGLNITYNGLVGIGTTAPTSALDVRGRLTVGEDAAGSYSWIRMLDDESTNGLKYIHANSDVIGFLNGSGGWMSYLNNAGNWNPLSDARLKTNVVTLTGVLEKLEQIRGVSFNWTDTTAMGSQLNFGVIAQELEKVFPELVSTDIDGYKHVTYDIFAPILLEAIKEQQIQIASLSATISSASDSNLIANLTLDSNGDVVIAGNSEETYSIATSTSTIDRIAAFADVFTARLQAGFIKTKELVAETIGATNASIVNLTTTNLETDTIISSNGQIDIISNATVSGSLEVNGESKLGQLVANTAYISELNTEQVYVEELDANSARINSIEAKLANIENASVSGTLYAENIEANSISANVISGLKERLSEQIAETLTQPTLLASLFAQQTAQTDEYLDQLSQEINADATSSASSSATLAELDASSSDSTLIADNAFINEYFEVNGNAFIANSLKIGQSLLVGENTAYGTDYISYQPSDAEDFTFYIQPAGMGKLSLMAGLMQLDHQGFVTINGDLKVAGALEVEDNLKVKGTLLTNMISAETPGENIQVQLASVQEGTDSATIAKSNFEFVDETQTPVATFSANGDLSLTGSLRINNPATASESSVLTNSSSAGQAVLEAGATEITIMSDKVEENSMIYVTPLNSTNNQVLYVKNKITDSSFTPENDGQFTVAIDYVLGHNVTFNWWIIQLN
jgi:hypothetical protein